MYVIPNISFEQIICVCSGGVKMETNFFKVKITMPVIIVKINYFITYLFDMSSLC